MANGTKNVFVTQTKNAFLPYIQAFADFQFRYMNAQGQLAEKMYTLNKKKQGEAFVQSYGKQIQSATDIESLSKTFGQAITEAGAKGITDILPTLKSIVDVQSGLIGEEKLKTQATEYENFILGQYAEQDFSWKGQKVTGQKIIDELRESISDPVARYTILKNDLPNLAIKQQQGVTARGSDYYYTTAGQDAFGKFYDNQSHKIIPTKEGIMYDADQSGGLSEGDKPLPPTMLESYSGLIESKQRFNKQMNYYDKPKPLGIVDDEGHYLYAGNEGLFYFDVKDGKPTGEKVFVGEISQYSKVSVPKPLTGTKIEQGQVTMYKGVVLRSKDTAVTRLEESGHLERDEVENSVKQYNLDNDVQIAVKDIADDKLEKLYKELNEENSEEPLEGDDLESYQALLDWRANKNNYEKHEATYINQTKAPVILDAETGKVTKDTTSVPTFDFNADNWVQ